MAVVLLAALVVWTLVVLRLLGARATLSERTFAVYLVLGAIGGVVGLPFVAKLVSPYGEMGLVQQVLVVVGRQAVLLLPAVAHLFLSRTRLLTSVADAFLLGFAVGFGFDVTGWILAAAATPNVLQGLLFWPPGQLNLERVSIVGYGYWTGLLALALAAALRFARPRRAAIGITVIAFVWVALEQMALLPPRDRSTDLLRTLTLNGSATAWLGLLALVGLSWWEAIWMQRSTGLDVPVGEETLREWRLLLAALAKRDLTEYARLSALFRLRRQVWIARTELVRSPRDPELRLATRQLEAGLRAAEQARSAQHDALTGAPPAGPAERAAGRPPLAAVMPWDKRAQWQAVAAMALLAIVFALPLLPDSLERSIWEFPILLAPLPALPLSAVNAVLAAVLLWRYVAAAGRPDAENTDELMQFRAEQAVLGVCLAVVLLVSLYVTVGNLFSPYPSTLAFYAGARLPNFERGGLATALLLFGVAASGITLGRTARWRRAAIEARRAAALRNVLAAGSVFALAWLCLTVYVNGLVELHHRVGATAFSLGSALGAHGNNLLAFVMIALVLVLSAVVGLALRSVTQRIERFFIGGELARWS